MKCERTGNKTIPKCNGRASTNLKIYKPVDVRREHNHIQEPTKLTALEALQEMLARATISNDKPRMIMNNCQLNVDNEGAVRMVRAKNITKRIMRVRHKKVDYGPNPQSISDIIIPEVIKFSYNGEMFVYADSGFGDQDRVIILATEKNIIILKNNRVLYGDGTFSISPELFYQVYTVNVIIRG